MGAAAAGLQEASVILVIDAVVVSDVIVNVIVGCCYHIATCLMCCLSGYGCLYRA